MRIYVASSWRNQYQPDVVATLRKEGHQVYDFRNPHPGNNGFAWSDVDPGWQQWTRSQYIDALLHPIARNGFANDMFHLAGAEATVLVAPSGRSAHLELGYAIGQGQITAIYLPEEQEPELMYSMTGAICSTLDHLVNYLKVANARRPTAPWVS